MKGNDAVWHGVITAEKMSHSRSPASPAGGAFCDECRLPPNHTCANIGMWKKKLLPSVGLSYNKRGGVNATGSGYRSDSRKEKKGNRMKAFPD